MKTSCAIYYHSINGKKQSVGKEKNARCINLREELVFLERFLAVWALVFIDAVVFVHVIPERKMRDK